MRKRNFFALGACLPVGALMLTLNPATTVNPVSRYGDRPFRKVPAFDYSDGFYLGNGDRPFKRVPAFDFSDGFYRDNGINPEAILDRLVGQDERSVVDVSPHEDFADVRIVETTGGFKHNGGLFYYAINGKLMPNTFTNDEAGDEAREIANSFRAFLFPKADGTPLSPMPSNRRQDNIFETKHGYFSNNPLGLWLLVFVSWDGPNVNDPDCQEEMAELAEDNGCDLDGTPVLKELGEIEDFVDLGCLTLRNRALDGSQGFPWVI